MIPEISLDTARQLIDFSGGQAREHSIAWDQQLAGAVALHNILVHERVAYLADEVGMGKTYVALGVVSLFRHFNPGWRVLYIAPRENIQQKWKKELNNFTDKNWLVTDNRVRTFQGVPAYGLVMCDSLIDLVRQVTINPNRDFLMRLTSFSLGLSNQDTSDWVRKRDELRHEIPWLDSAALGLTNKSEFKYNYARAVNAVLPQFDMVVLDEGHNLKHGLKPSAAARNWLLAYVLGHPIGKQGMDREVFRNYRPRFQRALILSATPLESDYRELWNQIDVFGDGEKWSILCDPNCDDEKKQATAASILIRRLTSLNIGGKKHTKNQYRREWRNGGVTLYDEPLSIPNDKQRLIVALVQKKVAEVIDSDRFGSSFQIGMLSSFESFMETAKVKRTDDAEQSDDDAEREGIDTLSVNKLASSYYREFGRSLPHPKMDEVADSLRDSFSSGEKTLIFVRRIRSVDELTDKLDRHYDQWIADRLRNTLSPTMQPELNRILNLYEEERRTKGPQRAISLVADDNLLDDQSPLLPDDRGGVENFFAWFFRGDNAPKNILSGSSFVTHRLNGDGSAYSTFFEDNHIVDLLGASDQLIGRLADQTGRSSEQTETELKQRAFGILRRSRAQKYRRRQIFSAYQEAALSLLAEQKSNSDLAHRASVILHERFHTGLVSPRTIPNNFASPAEFLGMKTFFTELALRPDLAAKLCPEEALEDFQATFRRREQRHELLSAAARLGHAVIDLWGCAVLQLKSLKSGAREQTHQAEALITAYLDALEKQSHTNEFGAFRELYLIAANFDLILSTTFPDARRLALNELPKLFGHTLARQSPVAGMYGTVNKTVVQQFRMPGYPLVLVTTDLLQEGEDLHTFCRRVMHYGISWTPSAMEQRTGRIDRIGSLVQRELDNQPEARDNQKLQVFYPHLHDTVEVLQIERVYERMNRFIRMLHRSLAAEKLANSTTVNTLRDFVVRSKDIQPITETLTTPFDVRPEWLRGTAKIELSTLQQKEQLLAHFEKMVAHLAQTYYIRSEPQTEPYAYYGTVYVAPGGTLIRHTQETDLVDCRQQPFALFLHAGMGDGREFLKCISPVGVVQQEDEEQIVEIGALQTRLAFGKICAVIDSKHGTYDLTIESDLLFCPTTTQPSETVDLLQRVLVSADQLEKLLLGQDQPLEKFRADLLEEPNHG